MIRRILSKRFNANTRVRIARLAIAGLALSCSPPTLSAEPCSISDASRIDEASHKILHDFDESVASCSAKFGPSGIVYHPKLDRLIVVSDKKGQFAIMKTDGSEVQCRQIKDNQGNALLDDDFEGVTVADANDGFIYVGVESGEQAGIATILQVEISTATVAAKWRIGFPGGIEGNDGLESITFVADSSHAQGGTFYIGDQTAAKAIGKCELPIKTGAQADVLYGCSVELLPPFDEVSGLDYVADAQINHHRGIVFLSSDSDDKIAAFTPDGQSLGWQRTLPASSKPGQEGHAINGCELYISADKNNKSRKVHRYRFVN